MRLHKHKRSNRHRHAAARTYGWATFAHWFTGPESEQDADYEPQVPAQVSPPLFPALPPGSMAQRGCAPYSPLPPVTHTYRGGWDAAADLPAVSNRVRAALCPAFRLDADAPMFRGDDTTWKQFEEARMERLRRMQQMTQEGWPDAHGVNLGSGGPKTLVFSTSLYERFSDGTGVQPAVSR